jgi:FkbM family methyltransferase
MAMDYFPGCNYLLIEAQPIHEKSLREFCQKHPNAQVAMAAAGDQSGTIYFDAADPLGGQASHHPYPSHNIEVPLTTVDHEVETRKLRGPFLLKTDTHGFEVPIIQGAANSLKETDVIVMECYNFKVAPECLLFFEMCEFLRSYGFRCIDMVDVSLRLHDDALWQMDIVFVRESRPEFLYLSYR